MVKGDVNSLLFAGITPEFCPDELCFAAGEIDISNPESIPSHPHGFTVRSDYQCPRSCPLYPLPPRPPVSARLALWFTRQPHDVSPAQTTLCRPSLSHVMGSNRERERERERERGLGFGHVLSDNSVSPIVLTRHLCIYNGVGSRERERMRCLGFVHVFSDDIVGRQVQSSSATTLSRIFSQRIRTWSRE